MGPANASPKKQLTLSEIFKEVVTKAKSTALLEQQTKQTEQTDEQTEQTEEQTEQTVEQTEQTAAFLEEREELLALLQDSMEHQADLEKQNAQMKLKLRQREQQEKEEVTLVNVEPSNLKSFTRNIKSYDQNDVTSFKDFCKHLNTSIKMMTLTSRKPLNLDMLVKEEVKLDDYSSKLLCFILDNTLDGMASDVTRECRDKGEFVEAFKLLQAAWPEEEVETKRRHLKKQLKFFKALAGETIQSFNQRYLTLFNEYKRLSGETFTSRDEVEDYLEVLPKEKTIVQTAVQLTLEKKVVSLQAAMTKIYDHVRYFDDNAVLSPSKQEPIFNTVPVRKPHDYIPPLSADQCKRCGEKG